MLRYPEFDSRCRTARTLRGPLVRSHVRGGIRPRLVAGPGASRRPCPGMAQERCGRPALLRGSRRGWGRTRRLHALLRSGGRSEGAALDPPGLGRRDVLSRRAHRGHRRDAALRAAPLTHLLRGHGFHRPSRAPGHCGGSGGQFHQRQPLGPPQRPALGDGLSRRRRAPAPSLRSSTRRCWKAWRSSSCSGGFPAARGPPWRPRASSC